MPSEGPAPRKAGLRREVRRTSFPQKVFPRVGLLLDVGEPHWLLQIAWDKACVNEALGSVVLGRWKQTFELGALGSETGDEA